jgi:hypothetical protein
MKPAAIFSVAAMVPTLSEAMTVADSIDVSTKLLVERANIATFRSSLYEMYRKVERSTVAELRCDPAIERDDEREHRSNDSLCNNVGAGPANIIAEPLWTNCRQSGNY